jgi:hypothetical protein
LPGGFVSNAGNPVLSTPPKTELGTWKMEPGGAKYCPEKRACKEASTIDVSIVKVFERLQLELI